MSVLHAFMILSLASAQPQRVEIAAAGAPEQPSHRVRSLRVTVLSTMLTDMHGVGEWGFSALVEADGRRLLYDTGARPETVLQNARELGIDLSGITDVVVSHHHWDHTGGFIALREALVKQNPAALSRAHVGEGIFLSRPSPKDGQETNQMIARRAAFETAGGRFVVHGRPVELMPGVWLSGPVPRRYPERHWPRSARVRTPRGVVEDFVPEDVALMIDTSEGLVVITGCGHAGIVNTLEYARSTVREAPAHAVIGGLHLFLAGDRTLEWTATKLKELGLAHLLGAHCTGVEAVFRIRQRAGLTRKTAVVGAVGSSFTLGSGIDPLDLAR
jgi:7,8-dihydropterin-6-yl-methyl-4-(beta-D-ribofuranosyl)aminobenzene 5'-phosphate synthase